MQDGGVFCEIRVVQEFLVPVDLVGLDGGSAGGGVGAMFSAAKKGGCELAYLACLAEKHWHLQIFIATKAGVETAKILHGLGAEKTGGKDR